MNKRLWKRETVLDALEHLNFERPGVMSPKSTVKILMLLISDNEPKPSAEVVAFVESLIDVAYEPLLSAIIDFENEIYEVIEGVMRDPDVVQQEAQGVQSEGLEESGTAPFGCYAAHVA